MATATVSSFAALGTGARAGWAAAPIEAISLRWPRQVESKKSLASIPGLRELSITGQHVDYWGPGRLADAPAGHGYSNCQIKSASVAHTMATKIAITASDISTLYQSLIATPCP